MKAQRNIATVSTDKTTWLPGLGGRFLATSRSRRECQRERTQEVRDDR
jgi:hypothetical protein